MVMTVIYDKEVRIYNGEKRVSSISGAEKTGQLHVKEWNYTNTTHKNKLKMAQRTNYKAEHHKTLRGTQKQETPWHKSQHNLFWPAS